LRSHGGSISEEQRHRSDAPYALPAFEEIGFNYRMSDLQAAVGLVQLSKLDTFIAERDALADRYAEALGDLKWLSQPQRPVDGRHGWQSYVTLVEPGAPVERDDALAALHELGIGARPGTHTVPELGVYRRRRDPGHDSCPIASELARRTLALPLHNRMTGDDADYVVRALHGL
jgi:dTDP-4-amino-4,6-dideoxygalactose transaminase